MRTRNCVVVFFFADDFLCLGFSTVLKFYEYNVQCCIIIQIMFFQINTWLGIYQEKYLALSHGLLLEDWVLQLSDAIFI